MSATVGRAGGGSCMRRSSASSGAAGVAASTSVPEQSGGGVEETVRHFLEQLPAEVPPIAADVEAAVSRLSYPCACGEEDENPQLVGPKAASEHGQLAAERHAEVARMPRPTQPSGMGHSGGGRGLRRN